MEIRCGQDVWERTGAIPWSSWWIGKGNYEESMGVTLAGILPVRDTEIEVAISYSQVGYLVEGGGHPPNSKMFHPKFVLLTRLTQIKLGQRWREQSTNDCPNLRPIPWERDKAQCY